MARRGARAPTELVRTEIQVQTAYKSNGKQKALRRRRLRSNCGAGIQLNSLWGDRKAPAPPETRKNCVSVSSSLVDGLREEKSEVKRPKKWDPELLFGDRWSSLPILCFLSLYFSCGKWVVWGNFRKVNELPVGWKFHKCEKEEFLFNCHRYWIALYTTISLSRKISIFAQLVYPHRRTEAIINIRALASVWNSLSTLP